jgi:hypothetical protein
MDCGCEVVDGGEHGGGGGVGDGGVPGRRSCFTLVDSAAAPGRVLLEVPRNHLMRDTGLAKTFRRTAPELNHWTRAAAACTAISPAS